MNHPFYISHVHLNLKISQKYLKNFLIYQSFLQSFCLKFNNTSEYIINSLSFKIKPFDIALSIPHLIIKSYVVPLSFKNFSLIVLFLINEQIKLFSKIHFSKILSTNKISFFSFKKCPLISTFLSKLLCILYFPINFLNLFLVFL